MNPLRAIFDAGGVVANGWLHIGSTWSAEALGYQGFDSLTVDLQHSLYWIDTAIPMIQAISGTPAVPLVRVASNTSANVMKVLDAGAYGVICPLINTKAECEEFVGACKYHPLGYRSLGPTRPKIVMGADYSQRANEDTLAIAMIETQAALNNLEEIVSVPGLDMIYVGPGDLSLTMGLTQRVDSQEQPYLDAMEHIITICKAHNIVAGLHTNSAAYAKQMVALGFQFVTLSTDTNFVTQAANKIVTDFRTE